jgi:hypothetical protein
MSRFEVRVEIYAHPKGREITTITESYNTWEEADTAFCAWRTLTQTQPSKVRFVEFIEHREEVVHKTATKPDAPTNVVQIGSVAHANG